MSSNFFDFAYRWPVGEIQDAEGTEKLKRRVIDGKTYQFKIEDIRSRTKMGLRCLEVISKFKSLAPLIGLIVSENSKLSEDTPEEERKAILIKKIAGAFSDCIPDIASAIADEYVSSFVFSLCEKASVESEERFKPLKDPRASEEAFSKDLTLQIPVALTVLEVNLSDGFFQQIGNKI